MEANEFNLLGEKYKFIEQKRNIIYFSKYSFNVSEFQTIYNYVKTIKEKTFISVYSLGKDLVNNYIDFLCVKNNQKESEKVFIICSLFFLHYFSLFGYETNNSFEQFYINELAYLSTKFQISIKNESEFKNFAFCFYNTLQNEIKKQNYDSIKLLCLYYNPYILKESNLTNKCILNNLIIKNNILNIKNEKTKKFLTNILSAKERIVDLILEINSKKNLEETKKIFEQTNKFSSTISLNKLNNSNFINNQNNINDLNKINIEYPIINNQNLNDLELINIKKEKLPSTYSNSDTNTSFYSKRLLSELTKCEIEEGMKKLIDDISTKIEDNYLDDLINNQKNCYLTTISYFLCYIVEITSDMIREIPEFKNIKEDITLRFMVTAKNFYLKACEVYFSLFDLSYTNFDTFEYILKNIKFPEKYLKYIFFFCKKFSPEMMNYGADYMEHMNEILNNINQELINLWETCVVDKGKEFSNFCLC